MSIVYLNDQYLAEEDAKVSINDAGYYYGDGFYEVILLRDGKLIDEDLHFNRLTANFKTLFFKNYPSRETIVDIVHNVVAKNQASFGAVYIQCTRGCAPRTHDFVDLNLKPTILVKINGIGDDYFATEICKWHCCIVEEPRRLRCDVKMISLLPMVMAKYEAESNGFDDVIFYNNSCNSITEGSSFNVFMVGSDDKIITCPMGNQILPGCTRARVIELMKAEGLSFEERFISKEEFYNAKEVFLTASLKINAITKIDGKMIHNGEVGEITKRVRDLYIKFMDTYTNE